MKTTLMALGCLLFAPLVALGGGNSSIAELHSVKSIKIEDERIVIVGSGMIRKRVLSDAEHGDGTVFGQPAQWMHAKVIDCEFEIVPYHVRDDLKGVPGALEALSSLGIDETRRAETVGVAEFVAVAKMLTE